MAKREQLKRSDNSDDSIRKRLSQEGQYSLEGDHPGLNAREQYGGGAARGASRSADESLGNIDNLLGEIGGRPGMSAREQKQRRTNMRQNPVQRGVTRVGGGSSGSGGVTPDQRAARREELKREMNDLRGGAGNEIDLGTPYDDSDVGKINRTTPEQRAARREELKKEMGLSGGAADSNSLKKAEGDDAIGGLYRAAGVDREGVGEGKNKLARRIKGISRRRKILAGSGIGGIAGLFMAATLIAPVYRIPSLVSTMEDKIGAEVSDIVENRAERIVINYLLARAGRNPQNYVITGSPISDLYRTFQSRKIEKKIADRLGITFQGQADGTVRVIHDGRDLGNAKNYDQVKKIIDNGTIKSQRDFKLIVKSVTPAVRLIYASEVSKSFKLRYLKGLPFAPPKTPTAEEEPGLTDAARAVEAIEALTTQQIKQGTSADAAVDAWVCTLEGENCEQFTQEDPEAQIPDADSEAGKQIAENGTLDETIKEFNEAKDEAKDEAVKDRSGGFVTRLTEKLLTKVIGAVAAKTITSAIPWIGWIDLFATLQHALGTALENHLISRIPIMMKEAAYGAIWSTWEGYAHNGKAGKMPLTETSALNKQLEGAEDAEGYNTIYDGNATGGKKLSPKVGSNKTYQLEDIMNNVYNNFAVRIIIRGGAEAWYYTVGKLIKLVGDLGAGLVSWLLNITGINDLVQDTLVVVFGENWKEEFAKFAVNAILWLYGITIDPLAKGAEMLNNLFAGAAVAFNYYCHYNLGCRALTKRDSVLVQMHLQEQQREDMAMLSLKDRLFSTDVSDSLTSTLIRNAPADNRPTTVIASLFNQVANLPASLTKALSPRARAADMASYANVAGVEFYGALPSDIDNEDTAPEVRQQKNGSVECPKTNPETEFNLCQADYEVTKSLFCVSPDCEQFKEQ